MKTDSEREKQRDRESRQRDNETEKDSQGTYQTALLPPEQISIELVPCGLSIQSCLVGPLEEFLFHEVALLLMGQ